MPTLILKKIYWNAVSPETFESGVFYQILILKQHIYFINFFKICHEKQKYPKL